MDALQATNRPQRVSARPRLLRAAFGCLALKGYADTSVEDICLAAGCSKGAFYFHFPSREAVLVALVEEQLVMSPEASGRPEEASTRRVLLETWIQAVRYRPLRRLLAQRFRRWWVGSGRSRRKPTVALASALRTGLVVQQVIRPGTMEGVSEPILVRLGVEAPAA